MQPGYLGKLVNQHSHQDQPQRMVQMVFHPGLVHRQQVGRQFVLQAVGAKSPQYHPQRHGHGADHDKRLHPLASAICLFWREFTGLPG